MTQTTTPFIPLLNETGKFLFSGYGQYSAFIFIGNTDFTNRCENLIINYGLLHHGDIYDMLTGGKYILAPKERLEEGIINYFRGEVILERELNDIDYTVKLNDFNDNEEFIEGKDYDSVTWNEEKVLELAKLRSQEFWTNKVEYCDVLANFYQSSDTEGYNDWRIKAKKVEKEEDVYVSQLERIFGTNADEEILELVTPEHLKDETQNEFGIDFG